MAAVVRARLPFSSSAIAAVTASSAFSPSPDGISSGTCVHHTHSSPVRLSVDHSKKSSEHEC